jgi:nucleoside-diphosphate-sugar epimerase
MERRVPDISKITSLTGWIPQLNIEKMIDDMIQEEN